MDEIFNSNDNDVKLKLIDDSINNLRNKLIEAEEFVKMYKSNSFNKFIIEELLVNESKRLGDSIIYNDNDSKAEKMILNRLSSIRLLRNYLESKNNSIRSLRLSLEKEEAFREEIMKNINGDDYDN